MNFPMLSDCLVCLLLICIHWSNIQRYVTLENRICFVSTGSEKWWIHSWLRTIRIDKRRKSQRYQKEQMAQMIQHLNFFVSFLILYEKVSHVDLCVCVHIFSTLMISTHIPSPCIKSTSSFFQITFFFIIH